jgi:hypothetical protein
MQAKVGLLGTLEEVDEGAAGMTANECKQRSPLV